MRTWMQPSPKCPYGSPRSPCSRQQGAEVAQIAAEPGGRHRAVLPARPRLAAVRHPGRRAGGVLAHPPQRALAGRVGDDRAAGGAGLRRPSAHPVRLGPRLGRGAAADLHEQPRASARQRPGGRSRQVGGHPLDRQRAQRQQVRRRLGRRALVGVAEHRQRERGGSLHQPHRRLGQHREGALAAGERAGQVEVLLRQQFVQRVTGDAARQFGEPGAQQRQVTLRQIVDAVPQPGRQPLGAAARAQPLAAVGQHVQRGHVVRGGAPGHRVRAAGVVADHPAERAPAVGGRVGAEGQAVRAGRVPQPVEHHARLDDGGARVRVERDDAVHVPGEVQHHPHPGRLPRDRGAAAARHHRHPVLPAHGEGGGDVVGVPWRHDAARYPPVVRSVHGHQRARPGVEGDLSAHGRAQVPLQLHAPSLPDSKRSTRVRSPADDDVAGQGHPRGRLIGWNRWVNAHETN